MIDLKLGILYKDNIIVNHRSLLKVLFNPILRYLGFYIGTKLENDKLSGIVLNKQKHTSKIIYDFNNYNDYDEIIKKRIFF
jgi:hypothetical protein